MLESGPPIIYLTNFVENPELVREILATDLNWERRPDAPRCEYYINEAGKPYTYGKGIYARTYEPRPSHPKIEEIRNKLQFETSSQFEVCFLNRYMDQSDHLGWHADDSPSMDNERPIVTISLGVEREIWFRPIKQSSCSQFKAQYINSPYCEPCSYTEREHNSPNDIVKLKLENGSCCIMKPRMQSAWQHRIPKASFKCGERISLTFRGYKLDNEVVTTNEVS